MIEVKALHKSYGGVEAVRDISFTAETGAILGLLGPNGAGKTTVMKVLTGYHFPSSGTALLNGINVVQDPIQVKRLVGYLPESVPLYQDLTVSEYLDFIADVRQLHSDNKQKAKNRVIEACGLDGYLYKKIEELSKGYKQRLGLAQAILHDPPILILDEPTTGLDPNQIIEIRSLIRSLGSQKTVILSTHILQEVEAVCSKVIILNEGRIAAQGLPTDIGETLKGELRLKVRLKKTDLLPDAGTIFSQISSLQGLSGTQDALRTSIIEPDNSASLCFEISLRTKLDIDIGELIFDWAVSKGYKIMELARHKLSLEEIFVKLTSEGDKNE